MTAPRLVLGVCLLLFLTAATGLVTSASAHSEEQRTPQSPTLLWQTFPLKQHAVHQFAATAQVTTAARKATTERNAKAERSATTKRAAKAERSATTKRAGAAPSESTTFARDVGVVGVVGTMLAAFALLAVRRSRASSAGSKGAEIVGFRPVPVVRPAVEPPEVGAPPPTVRPAPETSTPRWEVAPHRPSDQQPDVERCEIVLWTGYVKKQFYAAPSGTARTLEPLQASSYFRLRDTYAPGARAQRALEDLLRLLEGEGWQVVSKGPRWYHYRLERLPWDGGRSPRNPSTRRRPRSLGRSSRESTAKSTASAEVLGLGPSSPSARAEVPPGSTMSLRSRSCGAQAAVEVGGFPGNAGESKRVSARDQPLVARRQSEQSYLVQLEGRMEPRPVAAKEKLSRSRAFHRLDEVIEPPHPRGVGVEVRVSDELVDDGLVGPPVVGEAPEMGDDERDVGVLRRDQV